MVRYTTDRVRPGFVALYDIRPENGAGIFLQPQSPHGVKVTQSHQQWHACHFITQKAVPSSYPLRTRAIPEHFCSGDSLRRGAISSVWTFTFTGLNCTMQIARLQTNS